MNFRSTRLGFSNQIVCVFIVLLYRDAVCMDGRNSRVMEIESHRQDCVTGGFLAGADNAKNKQPNIFSDGRTGRATTAISLSPAS